MAIKDVSAPVEDGGQEQVKEQTSVDSGREAVVDSGATPERGMEAPEASTGPDYSEFGLGDDFKGKDPLDVARHFHGQLRKVGETVTQREQALFGSPEWRQFQEWKKQQSAPKPAEAKEEPPLWNPPEFDERLVDMWVTTDEAGNRQWKPGTPQSVIESAANYYNYISRFDQQFRKNPYEAFQPFVDKRAQEVAEELINKRLEQTMARQKMLEYERQNAAWIYDHDEQGNLLLGEDGKPRINALGKATLDAAKYISDATNDQVSLVELARSLVRANMIESEYNKLLAEKKAAEKQNEDNKDFYKKAAERTANRSGSFERPGQERKKPQNTKKDFLSQAREAMMAAGQEGDQVRWS